MQPNCVFSNTLSASLSQLFLSHTCAICRTIFTNPVSLPCNHVYCSRCIRESLLHTSICPQCQSPSTTTQLTPLRQYDSLLTTLRTAYSINQPQPTQKQYSRLTPLSALAPGAKKLLVERLKENGLSTVGSVQILAERYKKFCICWNANLDGAVQKDKREITTMVMREENARAVKGIGLKFGTDGGGFDKLIETVKKRKEQEKRKRQRDIEKEEQEQQNFKKRARTQDTTINTQKEVHTVVQNVCQVAINLNNNTNDEQQNYQSTQSQPLTRPATITTNFTSPLTTTTSPTTQGSQLSPDLLQQIERKRQAAIAKKRQFLQRLHSQKMRQPDL